MACKKSLRIFFAVAFLFATTALCASWFWPPLIENLGVEWNGADDAAASSQGRLSSLLATSLQQKKKDERAQLLDPNQDGWETEAFSDQATSLLKSIGKLLGHPEKLDEEKLSSMVLDDFVSEPLRPDELTTVFEGQAMTVRRQEARDESSDDDRRFHGAAGLATALQELIAALDPTSETRAAFKVFNVELSEGEATTRVYFQASAETSQGHAQQNATWDCRWALPEGDAAPRLRSLTVQDYEETLLKKGQPGSLFEDCTAAVLEAEPSYQQQLLYGVHDWGGVIDRTLGIRLRGYHGIAVADVNGDDLEDIYVCEPGGLPNRLYLQTADGRLRDVSESAGVDFLDPCSSALLVDLDNDGDQDMVIASVTAITILSNDGEARFTVRTRLNGGEAFQPTAIDYDADGDLDLYISMYEPFGHEEGVIAGAPIAIPYHDANNGKPNTFYRNDGNWQFTDVTREVGLDDNNSKFSLAATWSDYDLDGDFDLHVANDFGRNNLYRYDSQTGKFQDVAGEAGVEDMSTGMSVSLGDYNRDGRPDLYVSNMWSSAGNRITYQRQFRGDKSATVKGQFQYLARGNSLFENSGDGTFRDVSLPTGVGMGRWAWGSIFADINNDGWEDLLVANGYITGTQKNDL